MRFTPALLTGALTAVAALIATMNFSLQIANHLVGPELSLQPPSPAIEAGRSADSAPGSQSPSFFDHADWLWKPIGDQPRLAGENATWVGYLSAAGTQHVAELYQEGTVLIPAEAITNDTPRYDITFTEPWGPDPLGTLRVPIPRGTRVPQHEGNDGHLAIQDPSTGHVFGLWQAKYDPGRDTWSASWGGMTPLHGDGISTSGSATGSGVSRYAGVVSAQDFTSAVDGYRGLNHALVFASDVAGPSFVPPAKKSDGNNAAGVGTPIPEGYRIQLDPALDVEHLPGITPGEIVVAKTLQTYGAYLIDHGGARMSFSFEAVPDGNPKSPGTAWLSAGFEWDYFDMSHIPWSKLRVLAAP